MLIDIATNEVKIMEIPDGYSIWRNDFNNEMFMKSNVNGFYEFGITVKSEQAYFTKSSELAEKRGYTGVLAEDPFFREKYNQMEVDNDVAVEASKKVLLIDLYGEKEATTYQTFFDILVNGLDNRW